MATSRLNGVLVAPGEEFSFNKALGDVSAGTGYQQAYVIKGGRTVLGDGGGVCQVSTTLFRALLNAGLPITERRAHSYRVGYYEQGFPPGLDATVYYPTTDLKFKNDTSNHILIQSRVEGVKLIFDIYGPDDGRKVVMEGPFQYDQKANGAMKAYFVRKTTLADGIVKEERFDSNYGAPVPLEKNPLE